MNAGRVFPLGFVLLLALAGGAEGAQLAPSWHEAHLARDAYDYEVRQRLVADRSAAGDHAAAFYHAAWLAWFAPREYSGSDAVEGYLRDRGAQDRVRRAPPSALATALAAVDARRVLFETCFNGAIAQQATRLRADIAERLSRAEEWDAKARESDPLVRMALAQLHLALDDALVFENTEASQRARPSVLRQAASRAAAVAAWLPESPGAHRTLAICRARLADLENRRDLWDLAIAEAERAHELDPADPYLSEFLWALHLRAGSFQQAGQWQESAQGTQHKPLSSEPHKSGAPTER